MKKPPSIKSYEEYVIAVMKVKDTWEARRLAMPCYVDYRNTLKVKQPQVFDKLKKMLNSFVGE